jgi:ATP synthase F1 delta subunit
MSVVDRTYAQALYDAAAERGRVREVQAELAALVSTLNEVPELRSVLGNPQLDPESKASVLEAAVGGAEADELSRNFLRLLAEKGRAAQIEGIHEELERLIARAEGQLKVSLTTAYELSEEEAKEIAARIERASGRRVEVVRDVDPDLIGGIVLQAGSLRADASVRGRIERMRRELRTRR